MAVRIFSPITFADEALSGCDAMVVSEGRIRCLGRSGTLRERFPEALQADGFNGAFVCAGFIDTHTHFLHTGLHMNMVSLVQCTSLSQMSEMLAAHRGRGSIKGFGFDETLFAEKRGPDRHDLDRVSPMEPVVIFRRDYHSCVVNSALLKRLEIPRDLCSPAAAEGIFRGLANNWIRQYLFRSLEASERMEALKSATEQAFSRGITAVHALEGGSLFGMNDLEFMAGLLDRWPLKIQLYPQITDIEWVRDHGLSQIGGCLLIDGSFGSRTAALSEPYADESGNRGILYFDDRDLFSFVERAHREGLQLSFHAIGDRAIKQLVDAYESALVKYPGGQHRHRIEHCELPDGADMDRIASLGLALAVQPAFEHLWGGEGKMYHQRLGGERVRKTNPFREYAKRGIMMAGGSDSDVTPMDPMGGIWAATHHPEESNRLTAKESLGLFTENAARIGFMEHERGKLETGYRADFTVLSAHPLKQRSPDDAEVLATYIGGHCVFEKGKERLWEKSVQ